MKKLEKSGSDNWACSTRKGSGYIMQGKLHGPPLPLQPPPNESHDNTNQWPVLFFVYFFSAPRPPKNLRKLSFNIYFCELTYLNLQKSKTVHFCAILSTSKKKVMTSQWRSSELMIWQLHFYKHKNTVSISEQFHFLKHITVIMFTGK